MRLVPHLRVRTVERLIDLEPVVFVLLTVGLVWPLWSEWPVLAGGLTAASTFLTACTVWVWWLEVKHRALYFGWDRWRQGRLQKRLVPRLRPRTAARLEFFEPFLIGAMAAGAAGPWWFPWSSVLAGYVFIVLWAWWLETKHRSYHFAWG